MKHLPIDTILLTIEARADFLKKKIEDDARYVFVCEVASEFDFSGTITYENKEKVYHLLQELCQDYDLNFKAIMMRILLEG